MTHALATTGRFAPNGKKYPVLSISANRTLQRALIKRYGLAKKPSTRCKSDKKPSHDGVDRGRGVATDGGVTIDTDDVLEGTVLESGEASLSELKHRTSTTPVEERAFCPVCESARVERKTGRPDEREHDEEYYCGRGHHFEEPLEHDELERPHPLHRGPGQ